MSFSYVLQRFVSAKESNNTSYLSKGRTKCDESVKMSGEEARTFYETVLSSGSSNIQVVDSSKACTRQHMSRKRDSLYKLNSSGSSSIADSVDDSDDGLDVDGNGDDAGVDNKKFCSRSRVPRQNLPSSSYHRLVNQFLKDAQEGRLRQIQEFLSDQSVDINVCDQFSWTALMCASHSGQSHVVKYLVEKGAVWKSHKDSQGNTALDLARLAKHFDIVELLMLHNGHIETKHKKTHLSQQESSRAKTKFWCSVCEQEFTDDKKVHQGSTVHLFNTQRKPQRTFYYIPEGNIGYQMMLKSGWNEDKGLGPEGVGRKFPVKTVLKRDRLGLGSKRCQEARVTHFGPNDCSAVKRRKVNSEEKKNKPKKISRKERIIKQKKERNWERNMRIYMNSE